METCGETVFLTVRRREELVFVDTVMPHSAVRMVQSPGERDWLHATSQGKVLLAFLPPARRDEIVQALQLEPLTPRTITERNALVAELERVREQGFAIQDEEREAGVRAVAAPVLDPSGYPVAALCIGAPAFRVSLQDLKDRLAPLAMDAARRVAAALYGEVQGNLPVPAGVRDTGDRRGRHPRSP